MDRPPFFPTHAHVLVCTGPRCSRVASKRLFADAWNVLEQRGLAYYREGGTVRLTEAGCLGACGHGPTVACYAIDGGGAMRAAWYHAADLALVLRIAERAHRGETLPDDPRRFGVEG